MSAENRQVLETLLAYNVQDTITLENLMVTAYNLTAISFQIQSGHFEQA
jgi:hypothetical protein